MRIGGGDLAGHCCPRVGELGIRLSDPDADLSLLQKQEPSDATLSLESIPDEGTRI